jgi:hypothetical protein
MLHGPIVIEPERPERQVGRFVNRIICAMPVNKASLIEGTSGAPDEIFKNRGWPRSRFYLDLWERL